MYEEVFRRILEGQVVGGHVRLNGSWRGDFLVLNVHWLLHQVQCWFRLHEVQSSNEHQFETIQ